MAEPGKPPAAALAGFAAVFAGALLLAPGGTSGDVGPPTQIDPTLSTAAARTVVGEFVGRLNRGEVGGAFALLDDGARHRPEAIDGLAINPLLGVREEYAYAVWSAALAGERRLDSCAAEPWVHLVDGVRAPEDALLLSCRGTFTSAFFAALGLAPMPLEMTIAVGGNHRVKLFKEMVTDHAYAAALLRYRRWLRGHHPDSELLVFTPGGTPTATLASARLMLLHAPSFAAHERGGGHAARPLSS